MKKISYTLVGLAFVTILFSCNKEKTTTNTTSTNTTTNTSKDTTKTNVVSYKNDIAPIMSANCVSCHNPNNPSGGINLATYAGVSANASSSLSAINSGIMPPAGKLSADVIAKFSAWIGQGKLNN